MAVFAKGARVYTVDFDALARSFSCSRRTVEMAVAKLRTGDRWKFQTVRVGRSYAVQVSDRNPSIKGVFLLKKKKEIPNTTPAARGFEKSSWVARATPPRRIQALAGWLARRELAPIHRRESRTLFRTGHALNFAADALHAGHARADIVDAYRYALRCVDAELAHLPAATRWEPSTLIKLARRRLADGLTTARRVALRRAALRPVPANDDAAASFLARVDSILSDESHEIAPFSFPVSA